MASKHYQLLTCALLSACEQLIQLLNFVNTWFFLFRWMHMLVYCSSALFNKLMFWGLYWHLTAWLESMWLNSRKNTMGCVSPLPKITVGEEGVGKYLSWFIFRGSAIPMKCSQNHLWGLGLARLTWASSDGQSEQISELSVCGKHWPATGSEVK